jgi:hypothetical protein
VCTGSQVSQGVPIDGVQLGPMLGKGSYGRVYHAYWQGCEVAIKVGSEGTYLGCQSPLYPDMCLSWQAC